MGTSGTADVFPSVIPVSSSTIAHLPLCSFPDAGLPPVALAAAPRAPRVKCSPLSPLIGVLRTSICGTPYLCVGCSLRHAHTTDRGPFTNARVPLVCSLLFSNRPKSKVPRALEGKGLEKVVHYECTASTGAHLCRHLRSAQPSPVEAPNKGGALEKPFSLTLYKPDKKLSRPSNQQWRSRQ